MSKKATKDELSQTIIQLLEERKPQTIKQLVLVVKEKTNLPEKKIIDKILQLQSEGEITFQKPPTRAINTLGAYLKTENAYWYWTTIIIALITVTTVFTIPEDAYPIIYVRYVLGTIFVLWLPGYSFIKALFPAGSTRETTAKSLDAIERVALSMGMSLALVPIVGLLLNYTPWGIRLTPIVLSLLALTTIFATAAIIREYQNQLKREKQ